MHGNKRIFEAVHQSGQMAVGTGARLAAVYANKIYHNKSSVTLKKACSLLQEQIPFNTGIAFFFFANEEASCVCNNKST